MFCPFSLSHYKTDYYSTTSQVDLCCMFLMECYCFLCKLIVEEVLIKQTMISGNPDFKAVR